MNPSAMIPALALSVAACTLQTVRVEVPVTVPCLGQDPAPPEYQFGAGDYPGEKAASKALLHDLNAAKQHAADLKTQMSGCRYAEKQPAR